MLTLSGGGLGAHRIFFMAETTHRGALIDRAIDRLVALRMIVSSIMHYHADMPVAPGI